LSRDGVPFGLGHVHALKGDAECEYWLHPDRLDIAEDFEYNCTPRLREVR